MSGWLRAVGPEGARGVVSWMRAGPGGSGPQTEAAARKGPGATDEAGCPGAGRPPPSPRDCEQAHRRPGRAGTGLGHSRDPRGRQPPWGSGRVEGLSCRPQGFGPLPGTAFCPCFSAPGQAGVVGGPSVSYSGPARPQLQKGSSLASPAVRLAHALSGDDGQSPPFTQAGSLSGAPRLPARKRDSLGRPISQPSQLRAQRPHVVWSPHPPRGTHAGHS